MKYLKFLLRHKWYVFIECVKLGIVWRGIKHDMGKFRPKSFIAYSKRFASGNGYDIDDPAYLEAFASHLRRSDHHWQYWLYMRNDETIRYLPMSSGARREMLADLRGSSKYYGTNLGQWFSKHSLEFHLHPDTKLWLNSQVGYHFEFKNRGLSIIYFECPFCGGYNGHVYNGVTTVNCTSTCGKSIDMYSLDPDEMYSKLDPTPTDDPK